jgi:hypothetical protein
MLSRAETDFLRGEKRAKPNQLRYLRHCVRRKIKGREYLYFAHTLKYPETDKFHVKWCYSEPVKKTEACRAR